MKPLDKVVIAGLVCVALLRFGPEIPAHPAPPTPDITKGMVVLEVVETTDNMPQELIDMFAAADVRAYLNEHCAKENGQPAYRIWDQHTDVSKAAPAWQELMKVPRKSIPWLYIKSGRKVSSGPPPKNATELLVLLKKYG